MTSPTSTNEALPSREGEDERVQVVLTDGPLAPLVPMRVKGAGAVICFEGLVRPTENHAPIAGLSYEVYEPMARRMLVELAQQTRIEFELLCVHVEHSMGFVPTYDCSFRLQVASKHRTEGLAGMDWFIIRMKEKVPIWKHIKPAENNLDDQERES